MFIDVASKIETPSDSNQYDWVNKQTYPLSQEALDAFIYTISNQDSENFTCKNNGTSFIFTSSGWFSVLKKQDILFSSDLSLVQVNGLRIMLEQAKIKTYGWN